MKRQGKNLVFTEDELMKLLAKVKKSKVNDFSGDVEGVVAQVMGVKADALPDDKAAIDAIVSRILKQSPKPKKVKASQSRDYSTTSCHGGGGSCAPSMGYAGGPCGVANRC